MTHPGPSHPGPAGPSQPAPPRALDLDEVAAFNRTLRRAIITGKQQPAPLRANGDLLVDEVLDEADRILAGPLPRLGEIIRDAERLGAQLIAVLGRQYDPESAPDEDMWPGGMPMPVADYFLAVAVSSVRTGLSALAHLAGLPLPVAGSAIKTPARQDPEAPGPGARIATTGGPDQTTRCETGEEPTPGSAAAAPVAACESDGGLTLPVAGASSGPSRLPASTRGNGHPSESRREPRGAGPGYLGPPLCDNGCVTECAMADET